MASSKTATSFDDIIQADRQRRKNEALANEIFGRSRTGKDSSRSNDKGSSRSSSLASRVGIVKRSSPATSIGSHKVSTFNPPSRPSSAAQNARSERMSSAINSHQANIVAPQPRPSGPGLSIKGQAGPFVVEASNFAPGTTAADIESALANETIDSEGRNDLLSCRIMATNPTVIAEMMFSERRIADRVISTYNNQKADGRILHLYLKRSGGSIPPTHSKRNQAYQGSEQKNPVKHDQVVMEDSEMETHDPNTETAYNDDRAVADQGRRNRESGRAQPVVHVDSALDADMRMQSENKYNSENRDGESTREQGRRYEGRSDRGNGYQRDINDDRNTRYSHYGNGVGGRAVPGPPSRGYGGRMYSDEMSRGGRGYRRFR